MFHTSLNDKTDYKLQKVNERLLSEFKFFSKVSDGNSESIYDIAQSLDETKNWNIKSLKLQKIRNIISKASISELIKYMKCELDVIRSIAAQAFAECQSPNLLNCIDMMLNDNNESLKIACMETLFYLNSIETLELFERGINDQSANVRMKALVGIAELARVYKSDAAVELLNYAINDPDAEIREFVFDELGLIGNKNSVSQLLKALDTSDFEEKEIITESLNIILSRALG